MESLLCKETIWLVMMAKKRTRKEFESVMLPHLASAYRLAFWLLRHDFDAEDAVQDAYLKAFRAFDSWHGENASGWLLKIVRNTCITRLGKRSAHTNIVHLDTVTGAIGNNIPTIVMKDETPLPDEVLIATNEQTSTRLALRQLPSDYYEVMILREFEDLSYKQISEIVDVPIGTVMSRLSRARRRLRDLLNPLDSGETKHEM